MWLESRLKPRNYPNTDEEFFQILMRVSLPGYPITIEGSKHHISLRVWQPFGAVANYAPMLSSFSINKCFSKGIKKSLRSAFVEADDKSRYTRNEA